MDEEAILAAALDMPAGPDRATFIEEACRGDAQLKYRVEALLASHEQAGTFLNKPAAPSATAARPIAESPGTEIGPYKLLQQIGEGGMGVVYMAEQSRPIARRVAVKIIKPGMDTRQVVARFEAERQALALMDHQNIAKILDAGTTETGRPYFVMDLVMGAPITQYCDEHHLTPHQRLGLFVEVCKAVQHAHQKGIIHRDLKPSNVLVAEYDHQPVPKIIDFGVAKAIGQRLTAKTMFTEYGQIVGTFDYMSPEQAKLNQLDIDTRSDVYSLGVLLYELLTGETPLDRTRLGLAAFDELLRIVREEEPPRPSARLSTCKSLPTVAANRHTEPKKLSMLVRGELDWIVMKSLEKDRGLRYESANGLAAEVERFLDGQPVEAHPPTALYRLRKFVRRYRLPVAAALLLVMLLLVALFLEAKSLRIVRILREKDKQAAITSARALRAEKTLRENAKQAAFELREKLFDQGLELIFSAEMDEVIRVVEQLREIGATDLADKLDAARLAYACRGKEALELLKQAVARRPNSIGLRILLMHALDEENHMPEFMDSYQDLRRLGDPVSAEDLLFAAQAFAGMDPNRAERCASRSFELRKVPLALLVLGRARALRALDTGDTTWADEAVDDVNAARLFLVEGTYVRLVTLMTHLAVAHALLAEDDHAGWQRYLDEAEGVVEAIEGQTTLTGWERYYLAVYYGAVGYREKEIQIYRQEPKAIWTDLHCFRQLARLEELGEEQDEDLVAQIERGDVGPLSAAGRAFLLALDGDPERAIGLSGRLLESCDWLTGAIYASDVLSLCGKNEEAKKVAQEQIAIWKGRNLNPWNEWERSHLLPYRAGLCDEVTLLDSARKSDYSRRWLTFAHWAIAMRHLGDGDVAGAREHLQECQDCGRFHIPLCYLSGAVLQRLEGVDTWPAAK